VAGDILDCSAEAHRIEPHQVDAELERVRRAFAQVAAELEESARRISEQIDPSLGEIFRAHRLMLESLLSSNEFEKELRGSLTTAAEAVKTVFRKWEAKFAAIQDETLRERTDDIVDLARRVLRQLEGADAFGLAAMPVGSVLVTQRLLPSDVVALSPREVKAIVVESLGQGSHAALITREKGIPTLAGLPGLLSQIRSGDEALVDTFREALIISPSPDTRRAFDHRLEEYRASLLTCKGNCRKPAITRDGQKISVEANLAAHASIETVIENGADGVGLFRIEELYFARELPPSEEELFSELQHLVAPLREKPVTIACSTPAATRRFRPCGCRSSQTRSSVNAGCACCSTIRSLRAYSLKACCDLLRSKTFAFSCRWSPWSVTCNRCENCLWRSLTKWISKTFPLSAQ